MKYSTLLIALLAVVGLSACEKATTVNVPPAESTTTVVPGPAVTVPVPVPGPAGPPGAEGPKGEPGSGTTVIVPVPSDRP